MADTMRLDKLLGHTGYGTRRQIKELCRSGIVQVNGSICRDSGCKVNPTADTVMVGEEAVIYLEHYYIMMNKPAGVLSATEDPHAPTVLGLLPQRFQGVGLFPAGRLDKDTTGLLLLTNDGVWAHQLTAPKHHVDKVYIATVTGKIPADTDEQFQRGLVLADGYTCLPARALQSGQQKLTITLHEGKFHQVKRMCAAVGLTVQTLHRQRIGSLLLDEQLQSGQWRLLTEEERLQALKQPADKEKA